MMNNERQDGIYFECAQILLDFLNSYINSLDRTNNFANLLTDIYRKKEEVPKGAYNSLVDFAKTKLYPFSVFQKEVILEIAKGLDEMIEQEDIKLSYNQYKVFLLQMYRKIHFSLLSQPIKDIEEYRQNILPKFFDLED